MIGGVFYQTRQLGGYYLKPTPTKGGIYTEGIVGTFTNANPLYATGSVDSSVERLVFSGLFKFDQNNKLVGDLAKSWQVDERGTTYTVVLNKNLKWHDGYALTAEDVVYTYAMIQNPDAKSPLATSWQGIQVKAIDPQTISFTLPSILSAFPYSMTNGIAPKHLLGKTPAGQLRSLPFNTSNPIGSGPFKWEAVEVVGTDPEVRDQRIALVPNTDYVAGAPNIDRFIVRTFSDDQKLGQALVDREVNAATGLNTMPESLKNDTTVQGYNVPLTSQVMVFFKTTSENLSDIKVRQALTAGTDIGRILTGLGRPVLPVYGPLLKGQPGYDPASKQTHDDKATAIKLLDEAGWKVGAKGLRYKDKKPLSFTLVTQSNSTYDYVAWALKDQWQALGVSVQVMALQDTDLQTALNAHNYDALLYGIALGADPDVFAYWHSSQADLRSPSHLNFSEFRSAKADSALEAGRTRNEDAVRALKYKPFLDAWQADTPALALYQPRYLYVVREPLYGFSPTAMNSGADRFNNVEDWFVRVTNQPQDIQ